MAKIEVNKKKIIIHEKKFSNPHPIPNPHPQIPNPKSKNWIINSDIKKNIIKL